MRLMSGLSCFTLREKDNSVDSPRKEAPGRRARPQQIAICPTIKIIEFKLRWGNKKRKSRPYNLRVRRGSRATCRPAPAISARRAATPDCGLLPKTISSSTGGPLRYDRLRPERMCGMCSDSARRFQKRPTAADLKKNGIDFRLSKHSCC
ncbi:hypothetical protein EVAR_67770_1 [Eumeta japonica]|uniref:Uncharacterized protein n=1 Tax=Eumeta variegata TaxID=151549 RepID=A0A4C1ZH80_EUMVA|nr:hypothetical protein EVAR_67770_1 [Eumeta japonica]